MIQERSFLRKESVDGRYYFGVLCIVGDFGPSVKKLINRRELEVIRKGKTVPVILLLLDAIEQFLAVLQKKTILSSIEMIDKDFLQLLKSKACEIVADL